MEFKNFNDFTKLYSLSKTLRFELKPVGDTEKKFFEANLLEKDLEKDSSYEIVKRVIDEYHKKHINEVFSKKELKEDSELRDNLQKLHDFLTGSNQQQTDTEESIQKKLRERLVDYLEEELPKNKQNNKQNTVYELLTESTPDKLFKSQDFQDFCKKLENEDSKKFSNATGHLEKFQGFATYFTGFQENRKNIYSKEAQTTAIAYRSVHENFPIFVRNLKNFKEIKQTLQKDIKEVEGNLKDKLKEQKLESFFEIESYTQFLSQTGINLYNLVLGGYTKEDGTKIQGLNEKINLYNQNHEKKLPTLKTLRNQILFRSEQSSGSFRIQLIQNDSKLLTQILDCWKNLNIHPTLGTSEDFKKRVEEIFDKERKKDYDWNGVYIDGSQLHTFSHQVFGYWRFLLSALEYDFDETHKGAKQTKKLEEEKEKLGKKNFYSLQNLIDVSKKYLDSLEESKRKEYGGSDKILSFFRAIQKRHESKIYSILDTIQFQEVEPILNEERGAQTNLRQESEKVEKIKKFLDSLKDLQWFLKFFHIRETKNLKDLSELKKDPNFYNDFEEVYEQMRSFHSVYNQARNYLTKKPYSEEKIKLNFDGPTLLDGWDENKVAANQCVILRKNEIYYLGIINPNSRNIFKKYPENQTNYYEKMVYKLLPGANKMLPKVFFSDSWQKTHGNTPTEILRIRGEETFKKGKNFNKEDLYKFIDFYKDSLAKHQDWQVFGFKFRDTKEYQDISEFYHDIEKQGYKISFIKLDAEYIDKLVKEGKLFLFKIHNKDFSEYSKGKPNLHTIYWKNLFLDENFKNEIVYKLSGQAEVFYRKASLNYDEKILKQGHHYAELKDKFSYPIIKDRRYATNKFLFHVPISLNFINKEKNSLNPLVQNYLRNTNEDIYIIGIDRGERHLLYCSLINMDGKIVDQFSFNVIESELPSGNKKKVKYHEKLGEKEKQRAQARENWEVIGNIKELKEGYLSQVIHKITKLMVEKKAIIVLEDLNFGFKRGRFKVEKQVYQKFEKMLIEKLNYLVLKDRKPTEPGGALNAFQLTSPFESFEKLGKQTGFIFYVPAWNTSRMDPTTGFFNFIYPKFENIEKAKELFGKFDKICYNQEEDYFEFHARFGSFRAEPNQVDERAIYEKIKDKVWVICSTPHERFYFKKENNQIKYESIHVNEKLKKLFNDENIHYESGEDLKQKIIETEKASFLKDLVFCLSVLLQLRFNNGKTGSEERDFILSPVKNQDGKFFLSEDTSKDLPQNADANGAYHIAKKGLYLIEKLKRNQGAPDLKISNLEWVQYVWKS